MSLSGKTIAAGEKADLALVNLDTLRSAPVHDLTSAMTLSAHAEDVDTVLVDGKIFRITSYNVCYTKLLRN